MAHMSPQQPYGPPPQRVTTRRGANHGLHVFLSIITCGLWAITGWPIAAAMGRKTTTTVVPQAVYPPQAYPPQQIPPPGPAQQGYPPPQPGQQQPPPGAYGPPAQEPPPPGYGYPPPR